MEPIQIKIILGTLSIFCSSVFAQSPGGVEGSLRLEKNEDVEMADPASRGITLFCVQKPDSTQESALWSMESGSEGRLVMTNRRMADLKNGRYVNFSGNTDAPTITTYLRNRGADNAAPLSLRTGDAVSEGLPVGAKNKGTEYILYNRVLSRRERQKVESYLALKYDISLSQVYPYSYLSADGTVVWNADSLACYKHNIAGIGRDDESGLNKLSGASLSSCGLMRMESADSLRDKQFLLWGDDAGALRFEKRRGECKRLGRTWRTMATGGFANKTISLSFDASMLQQMRPLDEGERYWLFVENDTAVSFLPSFQTRMLRFDSIPLGKDGQRKLGIAAAPDFFVYIEKVQPSCGNADGAVRLQMVGGKAPFSVSVGGRGRMTANRVERFQNLRQGACHVSVKDADGKLYEEDFMMSNSGFPKIPEFEVMTLTDKPLTVSPPTVDGSYGYAWTMPDGGISYGAELEIMQGGVYVLTVTDTSGCSTRRELDVREPVGSVFLYDEFYPNPTSDGFVRVRVQLSCEQTLDVRLSDMTGRTLDENICSGSSFYDFTCYLPEKGQYVVGLMAGKEKKTYVFIRK
jgi:hypothetical protein